MRLTVTVRELEAFVSLAERLNFKIAAHHAAVSQPALTRIIQSVESKMNTKLFDRNTRRVELTPSGRELLPIARRILAEFNGALSDLPEFIAGRRGHISIACLPSAAAALLPPVMAKLQQTHPMVTVALHPTSGQILPAMVAEGSADFAVSSKPADAAIEFEPLYRDPFVLICTATDETLMHAERLLDIVNERPLLASGPSSSIRPIVDRVLAGAGHSIIPRYEAANISVLGAMVAAGLGISFVPTMALRLMDMSQIRTYPLNDPTICREIGLLTRRGRTQSSASTHFMDCLRQTAEAFKASHGAVKPKRPRGCRN